MLKIFIVIFSPFQRINFMGLKGWVLYISVKALCSAFILGGDQERGRRAGTHNTTGIVGLGEAIKICQAQMSEEAQREAVYGTRSLILF